MENKTNCGVCCDVCVCKHNLKGCECNLKEIKVTTGDTEAAHFCRSFEKDCSKE